MGGTIISPDIEKSLGYGINCNHDGYKCVQRKKGTNCWAEIPKGCDGSCGGKGEDYDWECVLDNIESISFCKNPQTGENCLQTAAIGITPCNATDDDGILICGNGTRTNVSNNSCNQYRVINTCDNELEGWFGSTICCGEFSNNMEPTSTRASMTPPPRETTTPPPRVTTTPSPRVSTTPPPRVSTTPPPSMPSGGSMGGY
tara:strand:- start:121 stop:723 length:603 start_codon:yes stop_codon:yes gene_type:complete